MKIPVDVPQLAMFDKSGASIDAADGQTYSRDTWLVAMRDYTA